MEDALRFLYVDQTRRGGRSKDRSSTRTRGRGTRRGLVERRSTPTRRPGTDANDKQQQCEWQTTRRKGRFAMMLRRGTDPLGPRHAPLRLVPRATCTLSSFLPSFLPSTTRILRIACTFIRRHRTCVSRLRPSSSSSSSSRNPRTGLVSGSIGRDVRFRKERLDRDERKAKRERGEDVATTHMTLMRVASAMATAKGAAWMAAAMLWMAFVVHGRVGRCLARNRWVRRRSKEGPKDAKRR